MEAGRRSRGQSAAAKRESRARVASEVHRHRLASERISRRRRNLCETRLLQPPIAFTFHVHNDRNFKSILNDTLKKPTPRSKLLGIYGFLPFGTGCRPTRCFLDPCSKLRGMIKCNSEIPFSIPT